MQVAFKFFPLSAWAVMLLPLLLKGPFSPFSGQPPAAKAALSPVPGGPRLCVMPPKVEWESRALNYWAPVA